jgi:hypothetical protein
MKSKAVVLGHPLHPMLVPFPFAFLTGAVTLWKDADRDIPVLEQARAERARLP